MIQATGDIGTQWILDFCNGIVKEGCIPQDWKVECGVTNLQMEGRSYREIKLLEHAMKVVQKIFEHKIRQMEM